MMRRDEVGHDWTEGVALWATPMADGDTSGPSVDSGLQTWADVRALMGPPLREHSKALVYQDVMFSSIRWR